MADLDLEDGSFHAHPHDFDDHHGFDRAELTRALELAGFAVVGFADCTPVEKEGTAYPVFVVTARREAQERLPAQDDQKGWLLRYLQVVREAMLWKRR